ncbi:MAG: lysostaphin resistance A-like protein, partial [Porcipelethomonas sp.]
IAGAGILIHLIASTGIMMTILTILQYMVMKKDGVKASEATVQYLTGLESFFSESSINIGINMLVLMTCSILVFLIGSKVSKIKIGSYFQTTDLTFKTIASYCVMSFFIRYVGGLAGTAFEMIFSGVDMSVGSEMMNYQNPKTIAVTAVYTCIAAPVTEELMYRGFVMKNLSRVSQRFGIIMSALLFGLMHGNISQFIFAFFMGIFFAHIDIRHNSLLPSIIVHAFANTFSVIVSYSGALDNVVTAGLTGIIMVALCAAGLVMYVKFYKKNRLPFTMPHQKLRNGTAVSSVMLVLSIAAYAVITVINSFPAITDSLLY